MLATGWVNSGEQFLELTKRLPADVLVVEGWIGREGIRAAVAEFQGSGYHYIVTSGGLTSGRWEDEHASYAKMAADEMIRLGIPKGKDSSRHPGLHRKAADIGICRCRVASPAECRYPA